MLHKTERSTKKPRFWHWFGASSLALLLLLTLLSSLVGGVAHAQTAPTPEPHPVVVTPQPVSAAGGLPAADLNPQDVEEQCVGGQKVDPNADDGMGDQNLCPDQVNQLKDLVAGQLPPDVVAQVKKLASDKIAEFGPSLRDKLTDKANAKQDQRLVWVAIILIGVLPILTFLLFMIYPLVRRQKIQARTPAATLGKIYGLYLPQAILVTIVVLLLGSALWGVQFLTGRVLGGVSNPQLVMQREALNYTINQRDYLIDNYTDIFVGVADDIRNNEDPDKSVMDIILSNALQLKDNPVVSTAVNVVKFVMPFLSYLSIVALGLLVLFFLLRVRPEIVALLVYPEEILAAQYNHTPLPPLKSTALGEVAVANPTSASMRKVGQRLMFNELKVVAVFAVAILIGAFVMSFVLTLFFYSISELLITSIGNAIQYFLQVEGAANTLLITVVILMVFVIETVALFLLSFVFFLLRVQDAIRQRFAQRITWKQTGQYMRRQSLRFGWLLLVSALFGLAAPFGANLIEEWLYNGDKDPNWTVALLAVPAALVVVLNLGMWLLRGFRMLIKMFKSSAAVEFGLIPPKTPKKKEAVAVS